MHPAGKMHPKGEFLLFGGGEKKNTTFGRWMVQSWRWTSACMAWHHETGTMDGMHRGLESKDEEDA